ncbi:Probable carboxyvinyl-carboxyphosphonate phosphorylmutase [hydrothermal vent metagenome]|uniref:Probable carboxyvinyl-carboxyphosphonate phosphorylmutase n=1 Tax=hydrothermal vent metagenome TaxID=652676 RepID=A0A3B0WPW0_9ZZZZ
MNFKNLHNQNSPLLICNVWDAMSAQIAEKLGFQAIGTSSAAMAAMLGYDDGEMMPFSELCMVITRITETTHLPLSVDIEAGYSRNPSEIVENIKTLVNLGVVGINIEDSVVGYERVLIDAEVFSSTLSSIKARLQTESLDVFINVRIDVFLMEVNNPVVEAIKRIKMYEANGANGVFVPCIEKVNDIQEITSCSALPINVMCMPNLPDFKKLKELGVSRVSMGDFLFDNMYSHFESMLRSVVDTQSFRPVISRCP